MSNGMAHATNTPEGKEKIPHSRQPGHAKQMRAIRNRRRRRWERKMLRDVKATPR